MSPDKPGAISTWFALNPLVVTPSKESEIDNKKTMTAELQPTWPASAIEIPAVQRPTVDMIFRTSIVLIFICVTRKSDKMPDIIVMAGFISAGIAAKTYNHQKLKKTYKISQQI